MVILCIFIRKVGRSAFERLARLFSPERRAQKRSANATIRARQGSRSQVDFRFPVERDKARANALAGADQRYLAGTERARSGDAKF